MSKHNIHFSRHAKRRMQLYKISEENIITIIENHKIQHVIAQGRQEVISGSVYRHGYPVKVVFSNENDRILVVTAYPLKRGQKS